MHVVKRSPFCLPSRSNSVGSKSFSTVGFLLSLFRREREHARANVRLGGAFEAETEKAGLSLKKRENSDCRLKA